LTGPRSSSDGVYHTDPHRGIVILTEDARLTLIDFGLLGRLEDDCDAAVRKSGSARLPSEMRLFLNLARSRRNKRNTESAGSKRSSSSPLTAAALWPPLLVCAE
jgi:predicted unusual protein kinase regulating ubiquinone biosynthesis (AarF/ABC1/UbiB family)